MYIDAARAAFERLPLRSDTAFGNACIHLQDKRYLKNPIEIHGTAATMTVPTVSASI